jgi:hypothetical protein
MGVAARHDGCKSAVDGAGASLSVARGRGARREAVGYAGIRMGHGRAT